MAMGDDDGGGESLRALDRGKASPVDMEGRPAPGPRGAYLVSIVMVGTSGRVCQLKALAGILSPPRKGEDDESRGASHSGCRVCGRCWLASVYRGRGRCKPRRGDAEAALRRPSAGRKSNASNAWLMISKRGFGRGCTDANAANKVQECAGKQTQQQGIPDSRSSDHQNGDGKLSGSETDRNHTCTSDSHRRKRKDKKKKGGKKHSSRISTRLGSQRPDWRGRGGGWRKLARGVR